MRGVSPFGLLQESGRSLRDVGAFTALRVPAGRRKMGLGSQTRFFAFAVRFNPCGIFSSFTDFADFRRFSADYRLQTTGHRCLPFRISLLLPIRRGRIQPNPEAVTGSGGRGKWGASPVASRAERNWGWAAIRNLSDQSFSFPLPFRQSGFTMQQWIRRLCERREFPGPAGDRREGTDAAERT